MQQPKRLVVKVHVEPTTSKHPDETVDEKAKQRWAPKRKPDNGTAEIASSFFWFDIVSYFSL